MTSIFQYILIAAACALSTGRRCGEKVAARCPCGGSMADVYVEGCQLDSNASLPCQPCPGSCQVFLNCDKCSKHECLSCPSGKSGPTCQISSYNIGKENDTTTAQQIKESSFTISKVGEKGYHQPISNTEVVDGNNFENSPGLQEIDDNRSEMKVDLFEVKSKSGKSIVGVLAEDAPYVFVNNPTKVNETALEVPHACTTNCSITTENKDLISRTDNIINVLLKNEIEIDKKMDVGSPQKKGIKVTFEEKTLSSDIPPLRDTLSQEILSVNDSLVPRTAVSKDGFNDNETEFVVHRSPNPSIEKGDSKILRHVKINLQNESDQQTVHTSNKQDLADGNQQDLINNHLQVLIEDRLQDLTDNHSQLLIDNHQQDLNADREQDMTDDHQQDHAELLSVSNNQESLIEFQNKDGYQNTDNQTESQTKTTVKFKYIHIANDENESKYPNVEYELHFPVQQEQTPDENLKDTKEIDSTRSQNFSEYDQQKQNYDMKEAKLKLTDKIQDTLLLRFCKVFPNAAACLQANTDNIQSMNDPQSLDSSKNRRLFPDTEETLSNTNSLSDSAFDPIEQNPDEYSELPQNRLTNIEKGQNLDIIERNDEEYSDIPRNQFPEKQQPMASLDEIQKHNNHYFESQENIHEPIPKDLGISDQYSGSSRSYYPGKRYAMGPVSFVFSPFGNRIPKSKHANFQKSMLELLLRLIEHHTKYLLKDRSNSEKTQAHGSPNARLGPEKSKDGSVQGRVHIQYVKVENEPMYESAEIPESEVDKENSSSEGSFEPNSDGALFRSRRSTPFCPIPKDSRNGDLDCTIWSYKKSCSLRCHPGFTSPSQSFSCHRSQNAWVPPMASCESGSIRLKTLDDQVSTEEVEAQVEDEELGSQTSEPEHEKKKAHPMKKQKKASQEEVEEEHKGAEEQEKEKEAAVQEEEVGDAETEEGSSQEESEEDEVVQEVGHNGVEEDEEAERRK